MQPNVVFVFADQWRAQATGYGGDPNVRTPELDRLAAQSVNLTCAVAGCPVCSPYRGSLLTGQYPLTHGVFVNDVCLQDSGVSLAEAYRDAGYHTAYIGKWHLDGHGRSNYIPPERRHGFDYWKVLECTHDYNASRYYAGLSAQPRTWEGYDAIAQTRDAERTIRERDRKRPFLLVLSWGPPHNPYDTAPEEYRAVYRPEELVLRPNVPDGVGEEARAWLAGYYAHCTALDQCVGEILRTLEQEGIADDTLFVFTSDHGDMLGSHGLQRKQKPWDESIRVPCLLRYPARFGRVGRAVDALIDAPDMMPTLLGLCNLPIPEGVEGLDFSTCLAGGPDPSDGAALIACYQPFGEWSAGAGGPPGLGGREYRGVRTARYTYAETLEGPWLLYDNYDDPYQTRNLVGAGGYAEVQTRLAGILQRKLDATHDAFLPGMALMRQWGYPTDSTGTVPYVP